MNKIYLDHSATTPVGKEVLAAMNPYFSETYGNASSIHNFGQSALAGVDRARSQAAGYFGAKEEEIIFTSGATESDNLAVKGLVKALEKERQGKLHIITSLVEHDAVLEPCMELEQAGHEVTYLKVGSSGVVDLEHLQASLKDNTVLVSIMWVNSEVGAVMPVKEVGKIVKKHNDKRLNEWKKRRPRERGDKPGTAYFHTDATQALNFCQCRVDENHIDLLSMSGHKIYGPKGVGLLYKRQGVPLAPLQRGGHHENNYRSGTLNVPGIVGLGAAIEGLSPESQEKNNKRLVELRGRLIDGIRKRIPDVVLNTDQKIATPAHAHFTFPGAEGESLLIALDLEGIAVSTGSACASGSLKASHVLLAMGIDPEIAHSSLRFSLGKNNTAAQIDRVLEILPGVVEKYRGMNPIYKDSK